MTDDPYSAPQADLATSGLEEARLESVAKGQKIIIYAILFYFVAVALQATVHPLLGLIILFSVIAGFVGTIMLTSTSTTTWKRVLYLILLLVPLIGLLVMVRLNAKATRELRAGGYKVGFLGANKVS